MRAARERSMVRRRRRLLACSCKHPAACARQLVTRRARSSEASSQDDASRKQWRLRQEWQCQLKKRLPQVGMHERALDLSGRNFREGEEAENDEILKKRRAPWALKTMLSQASLASATAKTTTTTTTAGKRAAHDNENNDETARSSAAWADAAVAAKVTPSGAERSCMWWSLDDEQVKEQAKTMMKEEEEEDQVESGQQQQQQQKLQDEDNDEVESSHRGRRVAAAAGKRFIRLWPRKAQVRPLSATSICRLLPLLLLLLMQITRRTSNGCGGGGGLIIYQAADCAAPALFAAVSALEFSSDQYAPDNNEDKEEHADEREHASAKTHVRVGILLEESNYEQANMFIRTIKMINEQKDETIRQLLSVFAASRHGAGRAGAGTGTGKARVHTRDALQMMQTTQQLADDDDDGDLAREHHDQHRVGGGGDQGDRKLARGRKMGIAGIGQPTLSGSEPEVLAAQQQQLGQLQQQHQQRRLSWPADNASGRNTYGAQSDAVTVSAAAAAVDSEDAIEQDSYRSGRAIIERRRTKLANSSLIGGSGVGGSGMAGESNYRGAKRDGARASYGQQKHSFSFNIKLDPMIEFLQDRQSALEADEKVCQLIESGVQAIFGPIDGRSIQHVQSICDNLEIPYFELRSFIGGGGGGSGSVSDSLAYPISSPPSSSRSIASNVATSSSSSSSRQTTSSASGDGIAHPPLDATRADNHDGDDDSENLMMLNNDDGDEQDDDQLYSSTPANDESLHPTSNINNSRNRAKLVSERHAILDDIVNPSVTSKSDKQQQHQRKMLNEFSGNNNNNNNNNNHHHHHQTSATNNKLEDLTLNLYPPSHLLNSAYIDLIYALNWTSFAIVYEDGSSMIRLQNIFKESSPSNSWANRWRIRLFRHDPQQQDGSYSSSSSSSSLSTQQHTNNNNNNNAGGGGNGRGSDNSNSNGNSDNRSESDINRGASHGLQAADVAREVRIASAAGASSGSANNLSARFHSMAHSIEAPPGRGLKQTVVDEPLLVQQQQQNRPAAGSDKSQMLKRRQVTTTDESGATTYRDVFWRVKMSGEHNILLDVKTENLYEALKQAQQVGCMTEDYSYLITSLDLHMINLEDFKYSRTKITGFSLLQVAKSSENYFSPAEEVEQRRFDEKYLENLGLHLIQQMGSSSSSKSKSSTSSERQHQKSGAAKLKSAPSLQGGLTETGSTSSSSSAGKQFSSGFNWNNEAESNDQTRREMLQSSPASLGLLPTVDRNNEQKLFDFFLEQQLRNLSHVRLSTSSAILHDSLILFMLGLNELDPSGKFLQDDWAKGRSTCSLDSQPWLHGSSLVNYMRQVTFSGLTGLISFDQRGLRSDFKLDVIGMVPNLRLVKVGEWHSRAAIEEARNKFGYHHSQQQQQQQSEDLDTEPINGRDAGVSRSGSKSGQLRATVSGDGDQSHSAARMSHSHSGASSYTMDSADAQVDSKSYDELSSRYEIELRRYNEMLAAGQQVHVPYKRRVSPNGALLVNDIIFERLYREQADKVDTLIVTAKLSQPYFMLKETPNKLDGNDQFEGYAVDLIHELSKLVNFRYKWREVADKKYGSKEVLPNGTIVWNGMIGEIVRGTADLAIVDLTITAQREEAVDFTLPFMNTGISILFKKPTTKVTTLFSFLSPFSSDVWAYVLAAYCGISAVLFLVGHLSPYEWADPHPCRHLNPDDDLTVLKNQFSLLNSFWFTIGSLMQQGSDLTPRSMSTRTIAGIWYFFTLIMISSYTANLAAFLTVEKVVYPIENVRDLSNQQEIKYGCVESGSTCLFFHDSQIDTYKKIDETMRLHKTYVRSNDEGQKRVGEGKFAFFMESTTIEYIIERNCNLTQIGGLIDSKGYGLATSKKSRHKRPYRTLLNEGILHLQETGMLHVLKNRWWKEKRGGGTCTDDGKGGGVTELSLANVGGVFVVLLGGLGISFLVAIAEFIWRARRSGSSRDRMCEEMMNDLKFALACKSSTKPIQLSGNGNNFKRVSKMSRIGNAATSTDDEATVTQNGGGGGGNGGGGGYGGSISGNSNYYYNNNNYIGRQCAMSYGAANALSRHESLESINGMGVSGGGGHDGGFPEKSNGQLAFMGPPQQQRPQQRGDERQFDAQTWARLASLQARMSMHANTHLY